MELKTEGRFLAIKTVVYKRGIDCFDSPISGSQVDNNFYPTPRNKQFVTSILLFSSYLHFIRFDLHLLPFPLGGHHLPGHRDRCANTSALRNRFEPGCILSDHHLLDTVRTDRKTGSDGPGQGCDTINTLLEDKVLVQYLPHRLFGKA